VGSSPYHKLLQEYWGYSEFRPKQEEIIASIASGHDVAVVMPTGGGKSLCFQLPALATGKTAIVVSPLLSLMQDQVAQLTHLGIPAAALNSTLAPEERRTVFREARQGGFRLLYMSPERLAYDEALAALGQLDLAFFAIDEAHCISEWGHEFRPDYRELSRLRGRFPHLPIAAFTASATRRVRHDILQQLHLREPKTFISSFFRQNLRITVRECKTADQEGALLRTLRAHEGQTVIVYAPTIARVEETADFLTNHSIPALPYHAKMDAELRRRNQERWMSDEVRVLVGTVAFGMGINKANVRAVVHLALPRSIEQYYQEAGRAGRDGLDSDCVLLWRKQDAGLLAHFIEQIGDRQERQRSWERYHEVRRFAEGTQCRQRLLCAYFGQTLKQPSCGACDHCLGAPPWLVASASRSAGRAKVRTRSEITPAGTPRTEAGLSVNDALVAYLKDWRRDVAAMRKVPAFVVLHDASLLDLAAKKPKTLAQLLTVHGFGRAKTESLGSEVIQALNAFDAGARAEQKPQVPVTAPNQETKTLLAQGLGIEAIAAARGRRVETVLSQVADLVESGDVEYDPSWIPSELTTKIEELAGRLGTRSLKPIKEAVQEEISYPLIRLVVVAMRRNAIAQGGGR
jgi:ATP-dependent DNA helicase RecQ